MQQKHLSHLEQQVMDVIWQFEHCSVRDVLREVTKKKKIAYTTTATILQRLYDKGLVVRKDTGKGYLYKPKVSKETYTKKLAQIFLNTFISSFGNIAIASFAESIENLPKEKKKYFLTLLEKYDKTK